MYEFHRKQMSEEEIEAREYVGFYRFWAWEYTKRNPEFQTIVDITNEAEVYFRGAGIPEFSMDAHILSDPDAIVVFEPHAGREFTVEERQLFEKAFLEKMKTRYDFGFEINGPLPHINYSSDQILGLLENGKELIRPKQARERSEGARLLRQREIKKGIKVLYDSGFPIFGYDALVAIDFDRPISEIQAQIGNVKEEFELYRKIENDEKGIQLNIKTVEIEKIGIQKDPSIQFKIGTDNSRAIGIWLWDFIQNSENPKKRGIISKAIRELRERFDIGSLGYGESESRVFRNILAKTKKCIINAEVLSLT